MQPFCLCRVRGLFLWYGCHLYSKHVWKWVFSQDDPEWKQWDAPYFEHHSLPYDAFRQHKIGQISKGVRLCSQRVIDS